jgi:hypothetical protein
VLELFIKEQLGQSAKGGKTGRKYVLCQMFFKGVLYEVSQNVLTWT